MILVHTSDNLQIIRKPLCFRAFLLGFYCVFGCVFSLAPLQAKEVDGLFEVSVPVADQNRSSRSRAIKQSLIKVVIRISGQSDAVNNLVVNRSLKKSSTYIQRYLYHEAEIIDEQGNLSNQLYLDLFFDEMALRNLLSDAALPRWGSNRPQLLVWVSIGDQQQQFLLGADDQALLDSQILMDTMIDEPTDPDETSSKQTINFQQVLQQKAAARGLPILLPLMDLEDSMVIDVADIWGRFVSPIRQASERYNPDAIAAVQLMRTGDRWRGRWLLLHEKRTLSWEQDSLNVDEALIAGIDTATDQLAEQYAVLEDSIFRNELLISVNNIHQLEDFAKLMDYLQNLTSIHSVNVANVQGDTLQLQINLIGEPAAMLQAISLTEQLVVDENPIIDPTTIATELPGMFFRWNGDAETQ